MQHTYSLNSKAEEEEDKVVLTCLLGFHRHIVPVCRLSVQSSDNSDGSVVRVYSESFRVIAPFVECISEEGNITHLAGKAVFWARQKHCNATGRLIRQNAQFFKFVVRYPTKRVTGAGTSVTATTLKKNNRWQMNKKILCFFIIFN